MNGIYATASRQTKYVSAVFDTLRQLGHATNQDLLRTIQAMHPDVSATTIHRVTARLKERGVIGSAPKTAHGSERYDSNPKPHHHFVCGSCSRVCDVPESAEAARIIRQLEGLSGECALAGTLTMQGICKACIKGGNHVRNE